MATDNKYQPTACESFTSPKDMSVWNEHPDYPAEDWAFEATNNDTRQSYWEWVNTQIEIAAEG